MAPSCGQAGPAGGCCRRARSAAAVLGLVTASAVTVHLSGGVVEAHFHFFVMVGVITLYQDWLPFGLALGYVVVHHTVLGVLAPNDVFNHPAAQRAPGKWPLIHGGFVLAASVAYLVNWRLSERQAIEISRLVSRLEGLARTDPLTGVPNRRVWEEELPRELDRARRLGTAVPGHDRPGRLQVLRRPPRPPGRRPRPQGGGLRLAGRDPLHRPAGPLPRGGVRAPAPGVRTRRRGPDRRAAPAGHPLVTCSVGLACWDFQEGAAELVERADQALHAAKAEGRNRYVLA